MHPHLGAIYEENLTIPLVGMVNTVGGLGVVKKGRGSRIFKMLQ